MLDYDFWIKKWQDDKVFVLDKDILKFKSFIYTPFVKANLYGFQTADVRKLLFADALARYQRMAEKNVLFPTGCHTLCNTSFVESKKFSNVLTDDIANIFYKQMLKLGIGINDEKNIDMRHPNYLSNLQQAFLDLYDRGYIVYKNVMVWYDKKNNKIYDKKIYQKNLPTMVMKSFVLNLEPIRDRLLKKIDNLNCDTTIKQQFYNIFSPQQSLCFNLNLSNGSILKVKMPNPEMMGGISFIFLNPDYIDITEYVDINEYQSVIACLENDEAIPNFAFSGIYALNPLTGKEIPVFISLLFKQAVYLAIPGADDEDRTLALESELEIINIIKEGRLINSDFLDGLTLAEAHETIFKAFIDAEIATLKIDYNNNELLLSSLDNFGPLFPFLQDKQTQEIFSLKGHLPYAFSSKLRPVLADNVDIVGDTMLGTINNMFTEGLCPIISLLYDNIGSTFSIFSPYALKELQKWNGIDYLALNNGDSLADIFMPLAINTIIEVESGVDLPPLFNKIEFFAKTIDISRNDIKRSNNNLVDFSKLLQNYSIDAIRLFFLNSNPKDNFILDTYQLEDLSDLMTTLQKNLNTFKDEDSKVDYDLFELVVKSNKFLEEKDIFSYANSLLNFIKEDVIGHGLSKKQMLVFIKLAYPVMPFLAEEIYKDLFNGKYSLINEAWPN